MWNVRSDHRNDILEQSCSASSVQCTLIRVCAGDASTTRPHPKHLPNSLCSLPILIRLLPVISAPSRALTIHLRPALSDPLAVPTGCSARASGWASSPWPGFPALSFLWNKFVLSVLLYFSRHASWPRPYLVRLRPCCSIWFCALPWRLSWSLCAWRLMRLHPPKQFSTPLGSSAGSTMWSPSSRGFKAPLVVGPGSHWPFLLHSPPPRWGSGW